MTGPGFTGAGLIRRADRLARERVHRLATALADKVGALPGLTATAEQGRVVVRGRRLLARRFRDARLRWFAGWLR